MRSAYLLIEDGLGKVVHVVREANGREYPLKPRPDILGVQSIPTGFGWNNDSLESCLLTAASILSDAMGDSTARAYHRAFATDFLLQRPITTRFILPVDRVQDWIITASPSPHQSNEADELTRRIPLNVPAALYQRIKERARKEKVGIHSFLVQLLEKHA
jgi:hypothetical protein